MRSGHNAQGNLANDRIWCNFSRYHRRNTHTNSKARTAGILRNGRNFWRVLHTFISTRTASNILDGQDTNSGDKRVTFTTLAATSIGLKGFGKMQEGTVAGMLAGNDVTSGIVAGIPAGLIPPFRSTFRAQVDNTL